MSDNRHTSFTQEIHQFRVFCDETVIARPIRHAMLPVFVNYTIRT